MNDVLGKSLIAAFLALLPTLAFAQALTGKVVGIADGDTLTLLDSTNTQHRIRLAGIDSPEKGQPFGDHCKKSLSDLVFGRTVEVESSKLDRYGRVIGKVVINGLDANLEQINRGCGWHYKKYQNEQPLEDRLSYTRAEANAREAGVGLWRDKDPVPPWEWRRARR